jgi:hypothetical protein
MTNTKAAPAATANALLDRGYGKPPQHITGEGGPQYVVRLPEPCKTVEEWEASIQDFKATAMLKVIGRQGHTLNAVPAPELCTHAIAPDGAGGDVFSHMHSVVAADSSGKS